MPIADVSVLLPVKDGARYLDQALASFHACREPRLELVVVDDGSTDATPEIIERWWRRDSRIVPLAISANVEGIVAALETARARARAPLVARLDADDIAYPDRFRRQFARFQADRDLVLLGTAVDKIDETGRVVGSIRYSADERDLKRQLRRRNVFVHSTTMTRASAVQQVGGYRHFVLAAEDYDLWLRVAETGRIANLPERLGGYRIHQGSTTRQQAFRQAFSAALARTCAEARRQNRADPAGGQKRAIDVEEDDWPIAFDDDVRLYRALAFADRAILMHRQPTPADIDRLVTRGLPPTERKIAQAALANILACRALPNPRWRGRAMAALIGRGPIRAARLLLGRNQPG